MSFLSDWPKADIIALFALLIAVIGALAASLVVPSGGQRKGFVLAVLALGGTAVYYIDKSAEREKKERQITQQALKDSSNKTPQVGAKDQTTEPPRNKAQVTPLKERIVGKWISDSSLLPDLNFLSTGLLIRRGGSDKKYEVINEELIVVEGWLSNSEWQILKLTEEKLVIRTTSTGMMGNDVTSVWNYTRAK
jgi:hypothetical protein